ncbi:MAG TPA: hypothetical protein VIH57_25440 [Bacteroidales bacterium]
MKKLMILISIIFTCNSYGQKTKDTVYYDEPYLEYTFIVYNSNLIKPKYILKVGVESNILYGNFECLSLNDELSPAANYIIDFLVRDRITEINADPIIIVRPLKTCVFKISLVPNPLGACHSWATKVRAYAIFNDGKKIYSQIETISNLDLANRKFREESIINSLKSLEPHVREKAVQALPNSTMTDKEIIAILRKKITDKNYSVRTAAVEVIKKKKYKEFAEDISTMLFCQTIVEGFDDEYKKDEAVDLDLLCNTIIEIRPDSLNAELLCNLFLNFSNKNTAWKISQALIRLQNPNIPEKIISFLETKDKINCVNDYNSSDPNILWKYKLACEILIGYRDEKSKNLIAEILVKSNCFELQKEIISILYFSTMKNQLIQDPYIKFFKPYLFKYSKCSDIDTSNFSNILISKME